MEFRTFKIILYTGLLLAVYKIINIETSFCISMAMILVELEELNLKK